MTAAPGDALVAPPLAMLFEGSNESAGPESSAGPGENFTLVGERQRRSFHPQMHGYHVPPEGTAETLESFHHCITCRNLVKTDDDFVEL
jgi:hypothetical protein